VKHTKKRRDAKSDLQAALRAMPPKVAQIVREGVKKHAPELLRGHG